MPRMSGQEALSEIHDVAYAAAADVQVRDIHGEFSNRSYMVGPARSEQRYIGKRVICIIQRGRCIRGLPSSVM